MSRVITTGTFDIQDSENGYLFLNLDYFEKQD